MFKEFYADMKEYEIKNKWMKFEFYFRQPFGLLVLLASLAVFLFRADGRMGKVYALVIAVIISIVVLFLYLTFLREKYSYHCWIALLVMDMFLHIPYKYFSIWESIVPVVFLILLVIYYRNRRDFFYKERIEEDYEQRERKTLIGVLLGAMVVIFMLATLMYGIHKRYMEKPAKAKEYIASITEDILTEEEAETLASGWITAVEEKNTEKIQKIIEEIYVEKEEIQSFLFLKQTEFQAGIDQEKCDKMLSYIDVKEHGMAYYSLARISHYYDARTSQNHEMMVSVQEGEEGICAILQHGKLKTEFEFIDMNEVVGEEGKDHFRNLEFSEEEIVSLLSDIYTDEDIFFVRELAEAAGEGEYTQLFQNDPDELSAYGQDALYKFMYGLMNCGMEYELDYYLTVTNQDFKELQGFVNSILCTRSGKKEKYFGERYLKILGDHGKVHMDAAADKLRQYYDRKKMVINVLPEFAINSQLNILTCSLIYRLNDGRGVDYGTTMQIEELQVDSLLPDIFRYTEILEKNGKETYLRIELFKRIGKSIARSYYSKLDSSSDLEVNGIDVMELILYGDEIYPQLNLVYGENITGGMHDANAILKYRWLEKEGLARMAEVSKEDYIDISVGLLDSIRNSEGDGTDAINQLNIMYLLWTGETCRKENGDLYQIQSLDDISYYDIWSWIGELERIYGRELQGFDYFSYDILHDYYFEGKEEDKPFDYFSYDMINDYYLKSKEDEEETAQQEEKKDFGKVEDYEYIKQIDLASADGNVYPVMVPKDFVLEEGDRFVSYLDNGFGLSMYARELFEGETLTDFMDTISNFIYEDPDRNFVNVNKTDQIEKDGLIYQICTADGLHSDGTTYPNARLAAAIPLGGTDVLAFHLEYASYTYNREGIKYLEEIGKYYKIPVDVFIELMEDSEEVTQEDTAQQEEKEDSGEGESYEYLKQIDLVSMDGNVYPVMVPKDFERKGGDSLAVYVNNGFGLSMSVRELRKGETLADFFDSISDYLYEDTDKYVVNVNKSDRIEKDGLIYQISTADMQPFGEAIPQVRLVAAIPLKGTDVLKFQLEYNSFGSNQEGVKCLEEIGKYYKIPVDQFIEIMEEYIAKKANLQNVY